ncbi:hypothetical protein I6N96_07695 [Enterococcus sp. BWM-S5]|uniref:DUF11 domain-containing protein n=1 Tax=Enterococcus larvae TaxID=2794352 RepID=A0ABS4CJ03_9ENTE|nr:hypothetical protein [Enterococcus larvae]MBP1046163.1 hypothetical protein [Enterococcus larvae]
MEQDFDFVALFQILNEYKFGVNQNYFLVAFSGIICGELNDDSKQFKKDWKTEIENGGAISEDSAKQILRRKMQLASKYRTYLKECQLTTDSMKMDISDMISKYLNNDDKLHKRLTELVLNTNNKALVKEKNRLLSYEDFNTFLSELILLCARKLSEGTHLSGTTNNKKLEFEQAKAQPIFSGQRIVFIPDQELEDHERNPNEHYLEKFKPELNTGLSIENKVRKNTDKHWSKSIEADENEIIHFQINVQNRGDVRINNILVGELKVNNLVVRNILPDNLIYIKGSTVLYNSTNPNSIPVNDDLMSDTGMNIGGYNSRANAFIRFSAKVGRAVYFPSSGINKFTNIVQVSNQINSIYDNAHVIAHKPFEFDEES